MEKWPGADKKDHSFFMVYASRSDIEPSIIQDVLHLYPPLALVVILYLLSYDKIR
jgi:hypothetical protein